MQSGLHEDHEKNSIFCLSGSYRPGASKNPGTGHHDEAFGGLCRRQTTCGRCLLPLVPSYTTLYPTRSKVNGQLLRRRGSLYLVTSPRCPFGPSLDDNIAPNLGSSHALPTRNFGGIVTQTSSLSFGFRGHLPSPDPHTVAPPYRAHSNPRAMGSADALTARPRSP
jgi:hypothetical protein